MKNDPSRRVLDFLGGQTAPRSPHGMGRRVLYQCNRCHNIWLQDGTQTQQVVGEDEVRAVAELLSADPSHLPEATCRSCVLALGKGVVEIDQYGGGGEGFGFNWECEPLHAHFFATIASLAWLKTSPDLIPDVVSSPSKVRALLHWLSESTAFPHVHTISQDDSQWYAIGNPPGFGMPSTRHWLWKGAIFRMSCPPFAGHASVTLAVAMPPEEPVDIPLLIGTWQALALQIVAGGIAGEKGVHDK